MEESNIVESFQNSLEDEHVNELIVSVGDIAFDTLLGKNILDGIPVLNLISTVYKINRDVRAFNLARKIYSFLYHISSMTVVKKQEFVEEYLESNQERTVAALLDVIDKVDNINKIDIICNLIKARGDESITIYEFNRLVACVLHTPFSDLLSLQNYERDCYFAGQTEMLFANGVVYRSFEDFPNDKLLYSLNRNGFQLLKYGFNQTQVDIPTTFPVVQPHAVYFEEDTSSNDLNDLIELHNKQKACEESDQAMFDRDFNRGK